ncbi:MAG: universal stress protein [Myxococcota bacterium]|nr:universal stress protein [Myxococcota bacterium]
MIETILVATDGSEAASGAERFGIALAGRLKARLSGCTVVEDRDIRPPNDGGLGVHGFPEGEVGSYYGSRAEAAARRLSARARAEGSEVACETARGSADDAIVARAQATDLAVLGRVGKGAASRNGLVGSTVDAVLRKASKSVVVVPPGASLAGPIVLGFDGSPGSRVAARTAVELANRMGEAVHVFVDSKDKGRAVARFEEVRQIVVGLSVPVRETSSTLGRPDVKLVDTAREARAGLIVMGAYGRNRITDFFLGSNAAAVARNSPIAVLLAR